MASLDDSPSLYAGQPWTVWEEVVHPKKGSENTPEAKEGKSKCDSNTMKLRKEDMTLFGLCPAQDEFCLVVCERCEKVIKPQALKAHIEQRHDKNLSKCLHTSTSPKTRKSPTVSSKSSHSKTANAGSLSSTSKLLHCSRTDLNKSQRGRLNSNTLRTSKESPSSQKLKNHHSMPVVKVERMPSPLMVKKSVSVADELCEKTSQHMSPLSTDTQEHQKPPEPLTQKASLTSASPAKVIPPSPVPAPQPPPPVVVSTNSSPAIPGMGGGGRARETGGGGVEAKSDKDGRGGGGNDNGSGNSNVDKLAKTATGGEGNVNSGSGSNGGLTNKKSEPSTVPSSVPIVLPPREKLLPCKDRVFDPNKHCGVTATDTGKPCTRSLTCKTHALSLRRAVQGRRKPFDQLLQEHRDVKEALLKAKAAEKAAAAGQEGDTHATINHTSSPHPVTSNSSSHHQRSGSSAGKTSPHKVSKSTPPNKVVHKVMPKVISPKISPKITHSPNSHRSPVTQSVPTKEESVPVPETCSRLSSDGEGDGDEWTDKPDYSHIPYHPRPAVLNTFGARLAGHGCYVLSRKTDLLRAAFRAAVERHLHPPPHKKLCVESKLPQDSHMVTDSKDPYEFNFVDTNSSASQSLNGSLSANKLLSSSNSKPKIKPVGRTIKPKEPSSSKSPVGAGLSIGISGKLPNSGVLNSNSSSSLKRKRSGSSPSASVNSGVSNVVTQPVANLPIAVSPANNPISIAIPTGINLNLSNTTLNNINATTLPPTATQPQPIASAKNNYIKDFSIVVTNIDPSVMNGQIISIPSVSLTEMTQLQLTSLVDSKNTTTATTKINTNGRNNSNSSAAKVRTKSNSSKHSASGGSGSGSSINASLLSSSLLSSASSPPSSSSSSSNKGPHHIWTEASSFTNIDTLMAAMANNNTVMMDSSGLASGTLLTTALSANSHAIALGNSNMSPPQTSPSTTPSPLFMPGSTSSQVSIPSPLPNGIVQSPPGIGIKSFSVGVNHSVVPPNVTVSPISRTSTPSPSLVSPEDMSPTGATTHFQKNAANKTVHASGIWHNTFQKSLQQQQQSHFQLTSQPQQPIATAISLTPGGRLITTTGPTNTLQPVYAGQMVTNPSGFTNIHIQPKPNSRHTAKAGIQQVLTLPLAAPPVVNAVTSQTPHSARTLFITSEDRRKRQLSDNSSSPNVIS